MPWCLGCDRFYSPNTLRPDGTCPTCGGQVGDPGSSSAPPAAGEPERDRAPWHFKVLVAATAAYLGWRLLEGIIWAAEHL
ncbi:MAG: hypothetical protein ACLGI8_16135 [Acidimicrobiia bacterium]